MAYRVEGLGRVYGLESSYGQGLGFFWLIMSVPVHDKGFGIEQGLS